MNRKLIQNAYYNQLHDEYTVLDLEDKLILPPNCISWCLYNTASTKEKNEKLLWGTYGKDGNQPLKFRPLSTLTTEHLEAILRTQKHISLRYKYTINTILNQREVEYNTVTIPKLKKELEETKTLLEEANFTISSMQKTIDFYEEQADDVNNERKYYD